MGDSQTGAARSRVVILGCGYVGVAVAAQMRARGFAVTGVTRSKERLEELDSLGCDGVQADLMDEDWYTRVPLADALVVNCLSASGGSEDGYRQSYLAFQERLRFKLEETGRWPRAYLYTSSSGVYPYSDGRWVTEADVPPVTEITGRMRILREAELLALKMTTGPTITWVLRLTGIYGPSRHYLLDLVKEGRSRVAGSGDLYLNLIHRDDAARAIACCLEAPGQADGVYNVSDGHPMRKRELIDWLADSLGRKRPEFDPEATSGRMQARALPGGSMPDRRVSNAKLRNQMGWEPTYPDAKSGYLELLS